MYSCKTFLISFSLPVEMNIKRKKISSNPTPALLCVALKMGYLKKKKKSTELYLLLLLSDQVLRMRQRRKMGRLLKHSKPPSRPQQVKITAAQQLCCGRNFHSPTQPKQSHARNGFISSLSGATSELKALIEQQVREQMMLVSGQLDQRIKEKASQQNSALDYSQNSHKAKK